MSKELNELFDSQAANNFIDIEARIAHLERLVSGLANAYANMTDGTNTAVASGEDTFWFRSSDSSINLTVTNDDATYGDNIDITSTEGNVDLTKFGFDAGGRQRVSQLTTLGDYRLLHEDSTLFWDQVVNGTATSTYTSSKKAMVMTTAASGDYVIRQSKQWHNYQSGKSHFVEFTFQDLDPETNVIKRAGYFSSSTSAPYTANQDGIYLMAKDSSVTLNVYKDGSQTYQSAAIAGVDWTKFTIAIVDFLWLGGSAVRLWLVQNGEIVLEDSYPHAGVVADIMMLSPNQPIRYEIIQDGAGSGSFDAICSQVASEGAQNEIGSTYSIDNSTTTVSAVTAGTIYALKGFRLQATRRNISTCVREISIVNTSGNRDFKVSLLLNPTVAGTFTYSDVSLTSIQEATGITANTNTVTGGFQLWSAYSGDSIPISLPVITALNAGSKIDGTMDQVVLCVEGVTNNQAFVGSIGLLEFT